MLIIEVKCVANKAYVFLLKIHTLNILKKHIILLALVIPMLSFAQQVENVRFEQQGKQIHIYYDLQGNGTYNVNVFCSTDGGRTWGQPLQKVTGAVSKNQKPGTNKEIIWDVLAERDKLEGEIRFKIDAKQDNTGTFTDPRDGHTYKWVKIGNQVWMAENLNYKTGNSWCFNDITTNCNTFGRLYNWEAARTACPDGWHLPSNAEWKILVDYLGGRKVAGGKMKETGTEHWRSPNKRATNESGFTVLPGGYRSTDGYFYYLGRHGYWWSATESGSSSAWSRYLHYSSDDVSRGYYL